MKIALFSDVHGKLRIVLRMLQCWQIEHRTFLDGALLAGDLGCFPDETRFDKATKRWIERDPEEAGFPRYFMRPKAEIEAVFTDDPKQGEFTPVTCPIVFVAGNHECFEYLAERGNTGPAPGAPQETFSVDYYRRIHCLRNGAITTLHGADGASLRVGGLWGVENAREGSPKMISKDAAQRLLAKGSHGFDLLLTHDAPQHSYTGHAASETISGVLATCVPPLHLFGHAHPVNGQHEFYRDPIPTRSWIFEDVGFGKKGDGSLLGTMGILTWEPDHAGSPWSVEIVRDSWASAMRQRSWMHVWPSPGEKPA
jgi:Icc-related predicted phosphoesterase